MWSIKMFGKLLRAMLVVLAFARCGGAAKTYTFTRVHGAIKIPYVEMSSRSAKGVLECAALCSDACWYLKYEDNGSGSGTCDLYILRDRFYNNKLEFANISNLYKKVYPPAYIFELNRGPKTWTDARDFCQSRGGDLAIADTNDKMDRMRNLATYETFWVGCQKNGTTWKWLSGAVLTRAPVENNKGTCLQLYSKYFDDGGCSYMCGFVCEYQP
ncbi:uncharacterized protein LOC127839260 [Dreissena polymorpha]|uniref:C-type lectin domain-containing protein n=1 Tax=Dreissena polymorpha TaxID=45954 RepID=A0A9D4F5S9_DREPO|nr:uncharacterized protein LOC127839260 [Dreissena polymorpha]KAH3792909.1 hypothetical protein DPMN_146410 [Dreissena polymorpha]